MIFITKASTRYALTFPRARRMYMQEKYAQLYIDLRNEHGDCKKNIAYSF